MSLDELSDKLTRAILEGHAAPYFALRPEQIAARERVIQHARAAVLVELQKFKEEIQKKV